METIDLSIIHEAVCEYFIIDKKVLFKKSRVAELIVKRQFFHYMCRILNPEYVISSREIGLYYSDVTNIKYDHATVLNSVRKIEGYVKTYKDFQKMEYDVKKIIREKLMKKLITEDDSALNVLLNMEQIANS